MTAKGTLLVLWAVKGEPSGFIIFSALPWSAVRNITPPILRVASITAPTPASTASTALTAASNTPV